MIGRRSQPPAPFVVGMNRSGTTLLRMMLDAHPQLTIPPETHFVPDLVKVAREGAATPEALLKVIVAQREWGDFGLTEDELLDRFRAIGSPDAGDAIRAFFEAYAERVGKPRWGDKTPRYVTRMRLIADALPEAHFAHVIRDGRDVALSVRDRTVKDYTVERVAQRWKEKVSKARRDAPLLKHYMELRYEDLVLDPEGSLRKISEFVDLPYDDAMLRYHEQAERRLQEMARELPEQGGKTRLSVERRMATHARTTEPPDPERVTRWRNEMSADDQAAFEAVAGDLLVELGYEVGGRDGGGASPDSGSPSGFGELQTPRRANPVRRLALRAREIRARRASSRRVAAGELAPAPFVVGATRSGTTLLRLMLDAHPEMAIPSETHFIPDLIKAYRLESATPERMCEVVTAHRRWGDFHLDPEELLERFRAIDPINPGDAARAFFQLYAEREGKTRWGDKTPGYVREMHRIESVLPEARFVHLVRDGRDVALSVLGMNWGPSTVPEAAFRWKKRILRAREQAPRIGHYVEIRYEDLVRDTEATLRRICEFVDLPYDEEMLRYHERASERLQEKARDLDRGPDKAPQAAEARLESHALATQPPDPERTERWRTEMSVEDRAVYEELAGDLLADLGYEVETAAAQRGIRA
jgi:Sulfotransferase family